MMGDMEYKEILLRVGTRVQVSLRIPSDELKRYLAHDLDDNLYRLIGKKIADGREYIVKVLDTHSELDEYGYCRIYCKEAIVALRNWRDATPGDAAWVTNEEDKVFSLYTTFTIPKPLDTIPDVNRNRRKPLRFQPCGKAGLSLLALAKVVAQFAGLSYCFGQLVVTLFPPKPWYNYTCRCPTE